MKGGVVLPGLPLGSKIRYLSSPFPFTLIFSEESLDQYFPLKCRLGLHGNIPENQGAKRRLITNGLSPCGTGIGV